MARPYHSSTHCAPAGLVCLVSLACSCVAWAETPCSVTSATHAPHPAEAEDDVRFTWVASPVTVHTGGAAGRHVRTAAPAPRLTIDLMVPDGFHVFRDDIHVTVLDANGLTLGAPVLPRGEPVRMHGELVHRFERHVPIEVPIDTAGLEPGLRLVHLQAEVRGCSASKCHAGSREHVEVYVNVVAGDEVVGGR